MKSYKHKDKRVHIPSKEEVGYEEASSVVSECYKEIFVKKLSICKIWYWSQNSRYNRVELKGKVAPRA